MASGRQHESKGRPRKKLALSGHDHTTRFSAVTPREPPWPLSKIACQELSASGQRRWSAATSLPLKGQFSP